MGRKRKHRYEEDDRLRRKIRRLKNQLHGQYYSSSDDEDHHQRSASRESDYEPLYPSDWVESDDEHIKSVVNVIDKPAPTEPSITHTTTDGNTATVGMPTATVVSTSSAVTPVAPVASTSTAPASTSAPAPLSAQILEALGDPKAKEEPFGPKIQDEISKRWGRVLVDGLNKEQRQELQGKILFPENFTLAKAPLLNEEIPPVLSETVKNRDRLLAKAQNTLGRGISGLTTLTSALIDGDIDKVEIIRRLSEVCQVFLDLHNDNTKTRRKLIVSSLDKKFTSMITDVKRDEFLFGANLGDKIKASKTAERSGLQVRRTDSGPSKRHSYHQSGNWRGPTRYHGPAKTKRGGPKNRYWSQTNRRQPPPPATERPAETSKSGPKPRRPQ